jgi:hypothetical protein
MGNDGADEPRLLSSTHARLFLQLCAAFRQRHTFESLHASFLQKLVDLDVPPAGRSQLQALAKAVKPEDTPGNTCKVISVCQTFLYGAAGNEGKHNINVVLAPEVATIKKRVRFNK